MQLFERIAKIAREIAGSQVRLAEKISVNPRTFQGYVQANRQDNLWPLLPDILRAYPQLSREWLYFDEGEMINGADGGGNVSSIPSLERENAALRELLASKDEIIALQKQLLAQAPGRCNRENSDTESDSGLSASAASAHGMPSAAPLSHQGTDRE